MSGKHSYAVFGAAGCGRGVLPLVRQSLAIFVTQPRGNDRSDPRGVCLVYDYSMPNVSDKVLRIVHGFTDYVSRVVWKNYG